MEILGSRINNNLHIFLISLAIIDDVCSVLVVTLFYSHHLYLVGIILAIEVLIIIHLMTLGCIHNLNHRMYNMGLFDTSGVHATIVEVILGFMTPYRR